MSDWQNDPQFESKAIREVNASPDGWGLTFSDGWSLFCPHGPFEPKPGDVAKLFGGGIGFFIRGIVINDQVFRYETEEQYEASQKAEQEKRDQEKRYDAERNRPETERRLNALPEVFQQRIAGFRTRNPDFWWDLEGYELFCCEQAVAIAKGLDAGNPTANRSAFDTFRDMKREEQKARVPAISDDHSGNTFGASLNLAWLYLSEPELIPKQHGSLCPLVGCAKFGCWSTTAKL